MVLGVVFVVGVFDYWVLLFLNILFFRVLMFVLCVFNVFLSWVSN